METIDWQMPSNVVGGAFRVQLRGFHSLHLFRFQTYQGDQVHADNLQKDKAQTAAMQTDLEIGNKINMCGFLYVYLHFFGNLIGYLFVLRRGTWF